MKHGTGEGLGRVIWSIRATEEKFPTYSYYSAVEEALERHVILSWRDTTCEPVSG